MATLLAPARVIKLKVEVDADRPCSTIGCRYLAPAPGPRSCRYCRALEEVERVLRRAADAEDGRLVDTIARVARAVELEAEVWTDPTCRQVIGLGIGAAADALERSRASAVRQVRDPILPDDGEDFFGFLDDFAAGRAALASTYDPNGPSHAEVERAELAARLAGEL